MLCVVGSVWNWCSPTVRVTLSRWRCEPGPVPCGRPRPLSDRDGRQCPANGNLILSTDTGILGLELVWAIERSETTKHACGYAEHLCIRACTPSLMWAYVLTYSGTYTHTGRGEFRLGERQMTLFGEDDDYPVDNLDCLQVRSNIYVWSIVPSYMLINSWVFLFLAIVY